MGRAASAVSLVVQDGSVAIEIKEPAMPGCTAGAGAAVKYESRLAPEVTAGFPVEVMAVANRESPAVVGLG